jgi:hypothetical protein
MERGSRAGDALACASMPAQSLVVLPTDVVNAADRWPVPERAVRPLPVTDPPVTAAAARRGEASRTSRSPRGPRRRPQWAGPASDRKRGVVAAVSSSLHKPGSMIPRVTATCCTASRAAPSLRLSEPCSKSHPRPFFPGKAVACTRLSRRSGREHHQRSPQARPDAKRSGVRIAARPRVLALSSVWWRRRGDLHQIPFGSSTAPSICQPPCRRLDSRIAVLAAPL